LTFAGESFVTDPDGRVIARAPAGEDATLLAECDLGRIPLSHAKKHFLPDRRPEVYGRLGRGD
jgi:N-carbamoylputrescine amidase